MWFYPSKIINVPIPDDDVIKTVSNLPRRSNNDGMVNVRLKRKIEIKKPYREETVDRNQLVDAVKFLKENHPSYTNIGSISTSDPESDSDDVSSDIEEDSDSSCDEDVSISTDV